MISLNNLLAANKSAAAAIALIAVIVSVPALAADWKPDMEISYLGSYESNIYHAYDPDIEVGDQLNLIGFTADWDYLSSPKLNHSFRIEADLDMYAANSNRNRYGFGVTYQPSFEYNRHGKFKLNFEIMRGKKDLIDDNGEVLSRTLGKTVAEAKASHYYRLSGFRTVQSIRFRKYNYDESYDSLGSKMTSFDFEATELSFSLSYSIKRKFTAAADIETERRFYSERRTLSLDKKSSQVRNYRRNGIGLELKIAPIREATLTLGTEFNRRKENYQNFYGYDEWRYGADVEIEVIRKHATKIGFLYRDKIYKNYYTSNIGLLNRIFVNYAVFEIEHEYRLTSKVSLVGSLQNLIKVSNDPNYNYHDLEGGMGVVVKM